MRAVELETSSVAPNGQNPIRYANYGGQLIPSPGAGSGAATGASSGAGSTGLGDRERGRGRGSVGSGSSGSVPRTNSPSDRTGRRQSIKPMVPSRSVSAGSRPKNAANYYYSYALHENHLPSNPKEFQFYAKLSKLSEIGLAKEVENANLQSYQFRTQHEMKMAVLEVIEQVR